MVAWSRPENLALLMGIVYGGWQTARRLTRYRFVPLLVGMFFYLVAMRRDLGYYLCICKPFLIYLAIYLVISGHLPRKPCFEGTRETNAITYSCERHSMGDICQPARGLPTE